MQGSTPSEQPAQRGAPSPDHLGQHAGSVKVIYFFLVATQTSLPQQASTLLSSHAALGLTLHSFTLYSLVEGCQATALDSAQAAIGRVLPCGSTVGQQGQHGNNGKDLQHTGNPQPGETQF